MMSKKPFNQSTKKNDLNRAPSFGLLFKDLSNPLKGVFELFDKVDEVVSEMDEKSSLPELSLFSGLVNGEISEAVKKTSIFNKRINDSSMDEFSELLKFSMPLSDDSLPNAVKNMSQDLSKQGLFKKNKHKYSSKIRSSNNKNKFKEKQKSESHLHGSVFSFSQNDREKNKLKTAMKKNTQEKCGDAFENKDASSSVTSLKSLDGLTKKYFDAEKLKIKSQNSFCVEEFSSALIPGSKKNRISEYNKLNSINTPSCSVEPETKLFSDSDSKRRLLKKDDLKRGGAKSGSVDRESFQDLGVNTVASLSMIANIADDIFSKKARNLDKGNKPKDSSSGIQGGLENKINNFISVEERKNKSAINNVPMLGVKNFGSDMPGSESSSPGSEKMSQSSYEELAEYLNQILQKQASLRGVDLS